MKQKPAAKHQHTHKHRPTKPHHLRFHPFPSLPFALSPTTPRNPTSLPHVQHSKNGQRRSRLKFLPKPHNLHLPTNNLPDPPNHHRPLRKRPNAPAHRRPADPNGRRALAGRNLRAVQLAGRQRRLGHGAVLFRGRGVCAGVCACGDFEAVWGGVWWVFWGGGVWG
ncbi:hypothetical protein K402DRAFT_437524 [Aulographum hederae CBS 113979]|uniref:Uncharacterized protein n=1 Tax=Aulographum hederae CBS 113979 TaxID=1176131 RepID=A0A6G1GPH5_9PEZI|nr:hypothetical protein K402DRAFT_437524 [Aulographum hederae CBS 113979]